MKIIGITGTLGAGKGTIVEYLAKEKGFAHYSVRNFLTLEINKWKLPLNRDSMVLVANDLRKTFSPGYIIEQLYEEASAIKKDSIIESIRAIGEINVLKNKDNFILLAVDADPKIRYDRIKKRASETDKIDYRTFLENEKREMDSDDPFKQNLSGCMKLADYKLINNGEIDELYKQMENFLASINFL